MLAGPSALQQAHRVAAASALSFSDAVSRLVVSWWRSAYRRELRPFATAAEALQKPQEPGPEDCCQVRGPCRRLQKPLNS